MTELLHFQWWTPVDLWGHAVLVTIPFLFMFCWWGNHGVSGDKAIEDSCSKLAFLSLHLWWPFSRERHKPCWGMCYTRKYSPTRVLLPFLHIVMPVNLLLLPVGHCLLKAISHSFIAPEDCKTAETGLFFSFFRWWHIFMVLHCKLLIKPWRTAQNRGKQNKIEDKPSEKNVVL